MFGSTFSSTGYDVSGFSGLNYKSSFLIIVSPVIISGKKNNLYIMPNKINYNELWVIFEFIVS